MYTKPSKSIVQQKIYDKIFDQAFKSIVKEAYLHSLVYDINQAEEGSCEALMQYADDCCDHLGCKSLLENAITSQPTGPKKTLLLDIYKVCESTATEVSLRATEGSKSLDQYDDVPLEELVRTAGFTKGEFKKFQNKVDSLGMDEIGGIIQNKVRDVLKQEHDDHVRIDKIDKELSDVVNQNNKEREEAKADMQPDEFDQTQYEEDDDLDDVGEADNPEEGSDSKSDESEDDMPEPPKGDVLAEDSDSKDNKSSKKESKSKDEEDSSDDEDYDKKIDKLLDQDSEKEDKDSDDKSKEDKKSSKKDSEDSTDEEDESESKKSKSDDSEEESKDSKDDKKKDSKDDEEALKESLIHAMGIDNIDHRSYFNTLQVAALENILWMEDPAYVNPDKIKYSRLVNLTLEAGLMPFRAEKSAMESLQFLNTIKSEDVREKAHMFKNSIMDGATTDAINVYTMMECFHTLNLIPLKYNDVRKATESVQPMSLKITNSKRLANNYLKQLGMRAAKESNTVSSIPAAHKLMNELESASEILHSCTESVDTTAMSSIDNSIEVLRKKLTAMESVTTSEKKVDPFILNQKKNVGIAQCNKVASMVKNIGPLAEAVVFEGTSDPNSYDVTIKRSNGIDAHTYVTMESISGNLDNDLKSFIMESNLGQKGMPQITFKKNDGKGTTEILKY